MISSPRRLRRSSKSFFKGKLSNNMLRYMLFGIIGFFILGMIIFAWLSRDLPEPGKIKRSEGFSTVFYDRDGKVLYELFKDKNRIPVSIKDVPENLKNATVAVEDKNFYKHQGFSTWGIARSMFVNLTTGKLVGGSTLTQQLVKNVLLTNEKTYTRKIKEVVLAVSIEKRFSKDEILEMYFNESPYGGTFWGVQSAAKGYFDKNAKDLNLIESAIIAGLPQRPSYYNPYSGEKDAYKNRTKVVLRRMREDGYITKQQEEKALKDLQTVTFSDNPIAINAPHFVFYVRDLVIEQFGEKMLDQGIKIKTSLSLDIQDEAQKIVKEEVDKIKSLNATNGAGVIIDNTDGNILAMVGSYTYADKKYGQFNVSTALRQPGSAIKPITYATAFEQGYTPSSLIMDVSTEFPNQGAESYTPVNYDGKFRGPVQYRFALANSYNVPAVKILANVGLKPFLQKAYDMGLNSYQPTTENMRRYGLSATLGGGETRLLDLTAAYSVFARGGTRIEPVAILEIRDNKNKVIYKAPGTKEKRVLSSESSFLISHILSDNNARAEAFGTRSFLSIPGKTVAAKTGTTNSKKDNWTMGFTKNVTVGVWVGNNDNTPMNSRIASGVTGASPIWNRLMKYVLSEGYKDGIMEKPNNVTALLVDSFLGGLPKDGTPTRSEYFIKGTEPTDISPFYKRIKISRNSGKLANDIEVRAGEYEEKEFIVITEKDPISTDGRNRWQEAIDAWVAANADARFKVPTETSDAKGDEVIVSIKEPGDKTKTDSNDIRLRAVILTLSRIRKVEIFVDNNRIKLYEEDKKNIDEGINLPDGQYEIRVRAENDKGKVGESSIKLGIKKDWVDATPTPTQAPTAAPTAVPVPTATPTIALP